MMGDDPWIDFPDECDEAHGNTHSGTSLRDNCEDMTPSSSDNLLKLNDSYIQEDGKSHISDDNAGKKKKTSRIIGWGLRRFSTIVCRKVQAKGRTTYNEVADEIIAELASGFDEKNIRRRVYDAFNVLIAIDVIAKDKKEIRWIGFPMTKTEQAKQLEGVQMNLAARIQAKANHLKELEQQLVDLRGLMLRNKQLQDSGNASSSDGIHLPFVLVRTHRKATVEIEISEDMRLVRFDFNETPYSLHDDHAILEMMRCPQAAELSRVCRTSSDESLITDQSGKPLKPPSFSWNSENMNV